MEQTVELVHPLLGAMSLQRRNVNSMQQRNLEDEGDETLEEEEE